MKKGVLKSEISLLFLIYYKPSKSKNNCFFTLFLGDLEGAGTLHCAPRTQAFKRPAPLGLNLLAFLRCTWKLAVKLRI